MYSLKPTFYTWRCFRVRYQEHFQPQHNSKKDTHPNQRILGVANGSEGAEVEDQGELSILQR